MEKFWNIIHYFAYKLNEKASFYFLKYIGAFKLYNTSFLRKRFKTKFNIDNPVEYLINIKKNVRTGGDSFFAALIMQALPIVFLFGLQLFYLFFFKDRSRLEDLIYPIFFEGIISGLLNYFLLFRKDKYIKYFKQFEKQPHAWKVKWAWISAAVILFPFLMLAGSFWAMAR